jgi:lipopolysaccharide export system protein LptA
MSLSTSRDWIRNAAWALTGMAAVVGGLVWARDLVRIDPFARLRQPATVEEEAGIKLTNVRMKHYKRGDLVAQASADELEVRKDRQQFDLVGVRDGLLYKSGEKARFIAERANYNVARQTLEITEGARFANENLDLQTDRLTYDQKTSEVTVPKEITGKLYGGNVRSDDFRFTLGTGAFAGRNGTWSGDPSNLPAMRGLPQIGGATAWIFNAKDYESPDGKTTIWLDATAEDGEVLVKGQRIEHDHATDVITVTGKVEYFSAKANLVCDKAIVYRKEKRADLTGNVRMLFKPKSAQAKPIAMEIPPFRPLVPEQIARDRPAPPTEAEREADREVHSARNLRDHPVAVAASRIEYWYGEGERRAKITGAPQARQEFPGGRWRHLWTFEAFYDGEKETLRLVGAPGKAETRVITSTGNDATAVEFEVSTQENNEWSKGKDVRARVYPDDDSIPKRDGG